MTYKPLTDLQIWGEEPDSQNDCFNENVDQDYLIEEMLEETEAEEQPQTDYFDANWCPDYGEPYNLCTCDHINQGEDYDDY